ncbi:hypothetical protein HNP65_001269 [Thermosipho japonicus]|uniref:Glycosyltransferase 2-like domain-containing protein n=1 Tax=Thermosipho japonicus TaxID=90323 RepID=A0A841GKA7_9BACT|nr:glycosyltransferase family 2 protein [Thermosipho japonicus]MBB6062817.1 hypothetical protein [Thermosipho japonicus]
MVDVVISIVLYNNSEEQVKRTIFSILKSKLDLKVILIDNSCHDNLRNLISIDNRRIEYIFNNANFGFGRAHNVALKKSIEESVPYHLVLNPDVFFEEFVLEELYTFMKKNDDIGLIMPKVLYPDGKIQYLCKLLPTPIDLIGRRFFNFDPFKKIVEKRNEIYELRFTNYDKVMEVPNLSGCCMFLNVKYLKKTGLFDERFFMYLEDTDLSRRIHKVARTIYFPYVYVYHEYKKGSYKNFKLLRYHIDSAIKYFNKWGWFFDKERDYVNNHILAKLGYKRIKIFR